MTFAMVDERMLRASVAGSPFWESYFVSAVESGAARVHLAVFIEPYLSYVLDGSKTIESRFTRTETPPYQRVNAGDILLLKRTGGRIEAICLAAEAWFYRLRPGAWREIREHFGDAMRVSAAFLRSRSQATFATLIRLEEVQRILPLTVRKRDRRPWVVLYDPFSGGSGPEFGSQMMFNL